MTKSQFSKNSFSTDKGDRETRKYKFFAAEGKNNPTIFDKIFDINLRSRMSSSCHRKIFSFSFVPFFFFNFSKILSKGFSDKKTFL